MNGATRKSARSAKPNPKYEMLLGGIKAANAKKKEAAKVTSEGEHEGDDDEWEDMSDGGYDDGMPVHGGINPDLAALLCQLKQPTATTTANPPPAVREGRHPITPDATVYLTGPGAKAEAPLDICDYVNLAPPAQIDINSCKGADDVLSEYYKAKTGSRRPKLQDLTVSQWGLANARIMDKLYFAVDRCDIRSARLYLAYTAKLHELFNKFERVSVLEYDRQYRIYQAAHKFEWGTDLPHLDTMTLRLPSHAKKISNDHQKTVKTLTCRLYNAVGGCKYGERCTFAHKCSSCGEEHPAFIHSANSAKSAPRSAPKSDQ